MLKFGVRTDFLRRYVTHIVGDSSHCEYWIPAEDMEELNANIDGTIEVRGSFLPESQGE